MQHTTYLNQLDEIIPIDKNKKYIQILFSGKFKNGHWVCSYYNGKYINIYDSIAVIKERLN